MNFFFDRCMPSRLARMVAIFDPAHTIRHHDDDPRFTSTTTDVEWLQALAQDPEPWIVISGDGRILKNRVERRVLQQTGLSFFCLSKQWMHMNLAREFAWKFIKVWPDIVANADITRQRFFEVLGGASLKVEEIR